MPEAAYDCSQPFVILASWRQQEVQGHDVARLPVAINDGELTCRYVHRPCLANGYGNRIGVGRHTQLEGETRCSFRLYMDG